MRILLVNKFLFPRGGAETAVFQQAELLREAGHDVAFFSMAHPENIDTEWAEYFLPRVELSGDLKPRSPIARLRAAARIIYSVEAKRKIAALVDDFHPDVAICHNIYHHISPTIVPVLRSKGVRTLLFLHDSKLVCPNYYLLTRGHTCERCLGGHYLNCVRLRCVGGSFVESVLCATELWLHRRLRLYRQADAIICPSRFLGNKLKEDGFYASMPILHIPNASTRRLADLPPGEGRYALYVGRLEKHKGSEVLVRAAALSPDTPVVIVGDGPDEAECRRLAQDLGARNVRFAGRLPRDEVDVLYRDAACLVLSSVCYENCPYVVIEAACYGKPSIVSNIGGMAELVDDGVTGLHFQAGDAQDLAEKLRALMSDDQLRATTGSNARAKGEREWTTERYTERLLQACRGEYEGLL